MPDELGACSAKLAPSCFTLSTCPCKNCYDDACAALIIRLLLRQHQKLQ